MFRKQRNSRSPRSRKVRNAFQLALVVTMLAALAVMALLWRDYQSALRVVEAADLSVHDTSGISIYAAPKRIAVGLSQTRDEFISHLQAAGYVAGTSAREPSTYWSDGNTLHVTPRQSRYQPVTVRLAGNHITSLMTRPTGAGTDVLVEDAWLEPEPIGAYVTAITDKKQQEDFVRRRAVLWSELEDTAFFWAVVGSEDHEFFQHKGVNLKRVVAAAFRIAIGKKWSGSSTLTMEFLKNAITLNRQNNVWRKLNEFFLAAALEERYSKEDIFTMWANHAPFGSYGVVHLLGVGAASEAFFGKQVSALDEAEAATCAALLPKPNTFLEQVKAGQLDDLVKERNRILDKMGRLWPERFPAEKLASAKQKNIQFLPQSVYEEKPIDVLMRPLVDSHVKPALEAFKTRQQLKPTEASGLVVETSFDADLMREIFRVISEKLPKLERAFPPPGNHPDNRMLATVAVLDAKTGAILALYGGAGGKDSAKYARLAIGNKVFPASTIKALWFALALERGIRLSNGEWLTPVSMLEFYDETTKRVERRRLRDWLARSNDELAQWLFEQVQSSACAFYQQFTGAQLQAPVPKMAIGLTDGLELTALRAASVYSVFANSGLLSEPSAIRHIYLDGKEQQLDRLESRRITKEETAFLVGQTLRAVVGFGVDGTHGTASHALRDAGLPQEAVIFAKTGSGPAGTYFISASPACVIAVQVGYQYSGGVDFRADLTSAKTALPLWIEIAKSVRRLRPDLFSGQFETPANLITRQINLADGCLYDGPGSSREYFVKGTEPTCVSAMTTSQSRSKGGSK